MTREDAEKIVDGMNYIMCSKCKQDKTGCTPEKIHECVEAFIKLVSLPIKKGNKK